MASIDAGSPACVTARYEKNSMIEVSNARESITNDDDDESPTYIDVHSLKQAVIADIRAIPHVTRVLTPQSDRDHYHYWH